jgi:hypothetical protein
VSGVIHPPPPPPYASVLRKSHGDGHAATWTTLPTIINVYLTNATPPPSYYGTTFKCDLHFMEFPVNLRSLCAELIQYVQVQLYRVRLSVRRHVRSPEILLVFY